MQLLWMILFLISILVACETSEPVDEPIEEKVGRRDVRLRSDSRWRQRDPERVVSDDDDDIDDDQSREDKINPNDGDPRRSRFKSDRARDGEDSDQPGRGRIRILSAGFRRTEDFNLKPLHDPTLRDNDLNRIDDHNIENELNALAEGLGQKHDVIVDDNDGHDNYEGLGFGDTKISLEQSRMDNSGFPKEIMDVNTHFGPPWTEWRHCNVTCGVGKQSRWRRCLDESRGICNRVTGREVEWRRCLGMECDQKTIQELGGGCRDQLLMSLLLGILIGALGSVSLSAFVSCLYAWCKKPIDWKLSDFCPESCTNCCTGCGESCTDCWRGCCDPYTGCCAGCSAGYSGRCLCCWCEPCCDPYAQQNRLYYHKQMRMNNAYQLHHNLGPPGPAGRMPYKRPPAPLPRESVKRKPYYDDPEYAEIDQFYQGSPRKKQKEKQNYVKFMKEAEQYDYEDDRPTKQKAPQQEENDYLEILGDEDVENAYLTPTMGYESDFEHLDEPPVRPQ